MLEDVIDLGGGGGPLQLLALQHLLLQLLDGLKDGKRMHRSKNAVYGTLVSFDGVFRGRGFYFERFLPINDLTFPVFTKASATLRLRPP